ncbi:MAG: hypothetical protein ACT4N4_14575, partial [Rhodospirillales bacterium]
GGVAVLLGRRGAAGLSGGGGYAPPRAAAALLAGASLSRAAALALKADPLFDLAATLGFLLGEPVFLNPTTPGESP